LDRKLKGDLNMGNQRVCLCRQLRSVLLLLAFVPVLRAEVLSGAKATEDATEPSIERAHCNEVVRRKELVIMADQLIAEAQEQHRKKNFSRALELYLQALDMLELAGRTAPVTKGRRTRTADGAYHLYLDWAEALARKASAQSRSEWIDRAVEKCHAAGNAFPERKREADALALKLNDARKTILFRELTRNVVPTDTW